MPKTDFSASHAKYIKSPEWEHLKATKVIFCPPKCVACEETAKLDLHHMRYPADLFDTALSDVCWLCRRHHKAFHKSIRKIDEPWNRDAEYLIRMTRLIVWEAE